MSRPSTQARVCIRACSLCFLQHLFLKNAVLRLVVSSGISSPGNRAARGSQRDQVAETEVGSDDSSSLEESVEEHKQPQTEEIMNSEILARVGGMLAQLCLPCPSV